MNRLSLLHRLPMEPPVEPGKLGGGGASKDTRRHSCCLETLSIAMSLPFHLDGCSDRSVCCFDAMVHRCNVLKEIEMMYEISQHCSQDASTRLGY